MTALPKHRHLPKGPKIKRISHQYIKNRGKTSKPLVEETKEQTSQPQSQQPQSNQRQGSYGYAPAQQAQQPAQQPIPQINQQSPVPGWWMAIVIVILAIFAFIFFFNLAKAVFPDIGTGTGTGTNCLTSCDGYAVVQSPGCDCPSDSYLSPKTPYAYDNGRCKSGCKQCICR